MTSVLLLALMVSPGSNPDFVNHVQPVLTRAGCNSGSCHGALAGKGGLKLSLRGYDPDADAFALSRQAVSRRIDIQHPADSLLLRKPTRALPHGGGKRFEVGSEEYRRLEKWIAAGAPPPLSDAPRVASLELTPPTARLTANDKIQLRAKAKYTDGRIEDVTKWVRFSSSTEVVATVDEDGLVTVAGPGETSISAQLGVAIAAATITSPFPGNRNGRNDVAETSSNFIDEFINKKLRDLNIPASQVCSDREYIRRAFLDAIGTLPTPKEVEAFVGDTSSGKRDALVQRLLERPEFVDYWTYKWCDVLLLSSRKMSQAALWSFHRFIKQAVIENRPWDRFARDVILARGSTLTNGAANYFAMRKDPAERAEATAVIFLGTSLTCARCHNHPLEKWTQDQYWAFANLFGRVELKSGERSGESIVFDALAGDVPHQRRGTPQPPATLDQPALAGDADRRAALADWLVRADNPAFAKATVNRIWKSLMGRGIVEPEDDLRATNPPSHPELFDALAADFANCGYDIRRTTRLVMSSAAYQRSAQPRAGNDSDDRYYSRYLVRRLPAEVLIDAYSQVTGVPTNFNEVYGVNMVPAKSDHYPLGTRAQQLPDSLVVSRFLDSFGRPPREQPCSCERQNEPSTAQTLHLNNGDTINAKLRAADSIVGRWLAANLNDAEVIRSAFSIALGREPSEAELTRCGRQLAEYADDRRAAFEDLLWAVLTSREFLFNH